LEKVGKGAGLEQQYRIQLQETGEGMIFTCDINYSSVRILDPTSAGFFVTRLSNLI